MKALDKGFDLVEMFIMITRLWYRSKRNEFFEKKKKYELFLSSVFSVSVEELWERKVMEQNITAMCIFGIGVCIFMLTINDFGLFGWVFYNTQPSPITASHYLLIFSSYAIMFGALFYWFVCWIIRKGDD